MNIDLRSSTGKGIDSKKTGIQTYDDNPLISACGPLKDRLQIAKSLVMIPPFPGDLRGVPNHVRQHLIMAVHDLHLPYCQGIDLAMTLDVILRQGYLNRAPRDPATWSYIYQTKPMNAAVTGPLLCASVVGISGSGKTIACERALSMYEQVVVHSKFPTLISPMKQLVWLKSDVPASGRLIDLSELLMRATADALQEDCFSDYFRRSSRRGFTAWQLWCHKAKSNFLGILVLDEIENLFRIESVKTRKKARIQGQYSDLRVIEDETLKAILTFVNLGRIGLIAMGTHDGIAAFSKRFSTGQRMVNTGHHTFHPMSSVDDMYFREYFFPTLSKYLWADEPIDNVDEIRNVAHDLSGGVQRVFVSLWIHAHQVMWRRGGKKLEARDFQVAMNTYLFPLRPAIEALKSGDQIGLAQYEDLLPRDNPSLVKMFNSEAGLI